MTYGYEAMIKSYVSPHRATSLDAVVFGINELKKKVPIWKKEIYKGDTESQWKENKECSWKTSEIEGMKRIQ